MEHFIQMGQERIELSEAQAKAFWESVAKPARKLAEVLAGDTVRIGLWEFLVLEQSEGAAAVILKNLLHKKMRFGSNNCYDGSEVDKACGDFAKELERIVGAENLLKHDVDLTSNDGLKDYGTVRRKVSLLTAEQYRKWVLLLDTCKPELWWWLATPFSTATHGSTNCVKCVSPRGNFNSDNFNIDCNGVRPFCILNSDIFVS